MPTEYLFSWSPRLTLVGKRQENKVRKKIKQEDSTKPPRALRVEEGTFLSGCLANKGMRMH